MLKLLFISTPVGALGSGIGGGVELTLRNLALELVDRNYQITILAPEGSVLKNLTVQPIAGNLQIPAQTQSRDIPITMPKNTVLGNMLKLAYETQNNYDLILNFAYDWLPYYLTPFFQKPIAHFISMGSLSSALDDIMEKIIIDYPNTFAVCSHAQANTFSFGNACQIVGGGGLDLSLYQFNPTPEKILGWIGRISPEKALEDAVQASIITGMPLHIFGKIQDQEYWEKINQNYPYANLHYRGFLNTLDLQKAIGNCQGVLMTPRWVEAFGNVAIESLACGVPVIAYRRGGPAEIVRDGETGFLVEPDSVTGLVSAIKKLSQIDRNLCRQQAETEYSLQAWTDGFEQWFQKILN